MKILNTKAVTDIKQRIDDLLKIKSPIIIGIDGMAASGKTTLANTLKNYYNAKVIHMDDFFLQDYQKTEKRLKEVDGYVDYERFIEEVIQPLKKNISFTYQAYNCQTKNMNEVFIDRDYDVLIIEGAYSLRENFREIYDLKLLMMVDYENQLLRIKSRNNKSLFERFKQEWIPRENNYIKKYNLEKLVDYIIIYQ